MTGKVFMEFARRNSAAAKELKSDYSTSESVNLLNNLDSEDFVSQNKFYVAMLSISLIIGICYCGYVFYMYWYQKKPFLTYILAISISLLLRTFFTLLLVAIFILGNSTDWPGANALLAFENFFQNMVFAYWLLLTIYFHESAENSFNSEPSVKLFFFGVPGVAAFFALIWTFIMAGITNNWLMLLIINPSYKWILNILRLLYLCIQLGLTVNIGKMILTKKSSLDVECINLLRKSFIFYIGLFVAFWIYFGFLASEPPITDPNTYGYFLSLVDGLQCAVACPLLYFLEKWGEEILIKCACTPGLSVPSGSDGKMSSKKTQEILIKTPLRSIGTIASVYAEMAERQPEMMEPRDVVYSSVVPPERLQKTFDLYKKLGIFSAGDVTIVTGDKFYECEEIPETSHYDSVQKESENTGSDNERIEEKSQNDSVHKKNVFYSSKSLMFDPKNNGSIIKCVEKPPRLSADANLSFR